MELPSYLLLKQNEQMYCLEPVYNTLQLKTPVMTISRPEGIVKINELPAANVRYDSTIAIKGLLGVINLHAGPYVIVVLESDLIGEIMEKPVYRVLKVDILPCNTQANLSNPLLQDELIFLGLLKNYLNDHSRSGLYYSKGYDLCSRLQHHFSEKGSPLNPGQSLENQFVANRRVLGSLLQLIQANSSTGALADHFALACIQGFVGIVEDVLIGENGERTSIALISRRSRTRFHSRGIDEQGNVSNFVETEQIVMFDDTVQSFTQVRGSIPVFWRHNINLRYKPPMELDTTDRSAQVFNQHFSDLKLEFGQPIVAINLVDSHGSEGRLAASFAKYSRTAEDYLNYLHFDYHAQVHGKTEPVTKLEALNRLILPMVDEMGWFRVKGDDILTTQKGIVRTNCIDCLDRTNVVQSAIARLLLTRQLRVLNLLGEEEHLTSPRCASLLQILRNLWADNGDAISRQYSGTGALKSDFTRTGKRTLQGAWNDLTNSLIRYYRNNFTDANVQDAMDLFFGKFQVNGAPVMYTTSGSGHLRLILGLGIMIWVLMIWNGLFRPEPLLFSRMAWMVISGLFGFGFSRYILSNGVHFVEYPKLLPPPIAIARSVGSIHPTTSLLPSIRPSKKVHQI